MLTIAAIGEFDVELMPLDAASPPVGRMRISESFRGDLVGSSIGEMLAVRTVNPASAGYVAMEIVTGSLGGRQGSFALQHSGIMNRGVDSLTVQVIPEAGTDGLATLTGEMVIRRENGKHVYRFEYNW